jgi:hypothetical protein
VVFKEYDGKCAIDAHTRYFTDRRHAPSLKHEVIPTSIDPHRHLDIARGANFIYTSENVVEYCEQNVVNGGNRCVPSHPVDPNLPIDDTLDMLLLDPRRSKWEILSRSLQHSSHSRRERIIMS